MGKFNKVQIENDIWYCACFVVFLCGNLQSVHLIGTSCESWNFDVKCLERREIVAEFC